MEQLGPVLLLLNSRACALLGKLVFSITISELVKKPSSFKDKSSTVRARESRVPVPSWDRGDTHLGARLTYSGVYPWQQLSPCKIGIDQGARMFIFLLKQTVCPSASIHAINWSLCSLLLEQGDRPRKGDCFFFSWLCCFSCCSRFGSPVILLKKKIPTRRRERPKQVTGTLSSDSVEMARGRGVHSTD